jgi:KDO2-lipid IV(A) lauroyltransferase
LRPQNLFPLMNTIIYWLGRAFIAFIQALPLTLVARLGRAVGGLVFYLTARYRRVVLNNLTMCFGTEKTAEEIRELAKENFRRIGENYACAIKTAGMSWEQLRPHVEQVGFELLPGGSGSAAPENIVGAIGHFGNFELYARAQDIRPDYQSATTYRALKQPGMDRLLQSLRGQNGCLFFERRTEGEKLRERMSRGGVLLGLLSDQSSKGLRAPFLGHDCNTGLAPAVFALRYRARLSAVICYRTALAKWRMEWCEEIPTRENGQPRTAEEIMRDVNRAFEIAVRRDPANWFWVHRRWKD